MNKNRDLIITAFLFFMAVIAKEFFYAGVWVFGSFTFFIVPGYWILKFLNDPKIEKSITHLAIAFPVSIAYLSLASFLGSQAGLSITYFSLMIFAGLPCLVWLSRMAWKRC